MEYIMGYYAVLKQLTSYWFQTISNRHCFLFKGGGGEGRFRTEQHIKYAITHAFKGKYKYTRTELSLQKYIRNWLTMVASVEIGN